MVAQKEKPRCPESVPVQKKKSNPFMGLFRAIWKSRLSYLLLAPYAIPFFIFVLTPVVISIIYSFTYYNMLQPPTFAGFDNYIKLFTTDQVFITSLLNTLRFALLIGPIGYISSFLIAWLINEVPQSIRPLLTLFFYSPSIAGSLYIVFMFLFSNDRFGYVNSFLIHLGILDVPINWLSDPKYMTAVVVIATIWGSMGAGFLSYIAGFRSVDKQFYEAAAIDGLKNRWQELWYVTLPLMKPQLMFGAIGSIVSAFSIGGLTMTLFGFPSTDYAAHTMVNQMYDYGYLRFDMGTALAIATLLLLMMIGCRNLIDRLLEKVGR